MTNIKVMDINIDINTTIALITKSYIVSSHRNGNEFYHCYYYDTIYYTIIPKNVNIAHRICYVIMIKLFKHVMIFRKTAHYYNTEH